MLQLPMFPQKYTEGRFWFLFGFAESLLVLDCVTTVIILGFCGGVELNPLVRSIGLFRITVYKLSANAFVGLVSLKTRVLWLLYGLSLVFTFVVLWNAANIFLSIGHL